MRLALMFLAVCLSARGAFAQSLSPSEDDVARIIGYSLARGGAPKFLETLTDRIGGRITGSPEDRAAADLILKTLKEAGFDNAHFEEYTVPSIWRHGPINGTVVSPV